jgi:hypothetical protein
VLVRQAVHDFVSALELTSAERAAASGGTRCGDAGHETGAIGARPSVLEYSELAPVLCRPVS